MKVNFGRFTADEVKDLKLIHREFNVFNVCYTALYEKIPINIEARVCL